MNRIHPLLILWVLAAPGCERLPPSSPTASDLGDVDLDVVDLSTSDAADGGTSDAVRAEVRVLFIGDSYTYVNDLPSMLRAVAASAGDAPTVSVESVAVGGATFEMQYEIAGGLERIRSGDFTHVVLQGQSVEPFIDSDVFLYFGAQLGVEARQRGAAPVYFETWARADGDAIYLEPWSGGDPAGAQAKLHDEYVQAAALGGGDMAPIGDAWSLFLAQSASDTLHATDGSHPTPLGTYLAACVLYRSIFGGLTAGLDGAPAGVDSDARAAAQAIADSNP